MSIAPKYYIKTSFYSVPLVQQDIFNKTISNLHYYENIDYWTCSSADNLSG